MSRPGGDSPSHSANWPPQSECDAAETPAPRAPRSANATDPQPVPQNPLLVHRPPARRRHRRSPAIPPPHHPDVRRLRRHQRIRVPRRSRKRTSTRPRRNLPRHDRDPRTPSTRRSRRRRGPPTATRLRRPRPVPRTRRPRPTTNPKDHETPRPRDLSRRLHHLRARLSQSALREGPPRPSRRPTPPRRLPAAYLHQRRPHPRQHTGLEESARPHRTPTRRATPSTAVAPTQTPAAARGDHPLPRRQPAATPT
jgi:hypothetical protein